MAYEIFDDTAFYYMTMTIILIVMLPWTLIKLYLYARYIFRQQRRAVQSRVRDQSITLLLTTTNKQEQKKIAILGEDTDEDENYAHRPWLSTSNIIYGSVMLILLILFLNMPSNALASSTSYDPYQVLQVDKAASEKEIQRAYRKLSLQFHPDKINLNTHVVNGKTTPLAAEAAESLKATAAAMFLKISKAYQTLTDPKSKENYQKYGKQQMIQQDDNCSSVATVKM